MTEWSVVTVIIALVGLIVTVAKPLMRVNSTMVHLSEQMQIPERRSTTPSFPCRGRTLPGL